MVRFEIKSLEHSQHSYFVINLVDLAVLSVPHKRHFVLLLSPTVTRLSSRSNINRKSHDAKGIIVRGTCKLHPL